MISLIVCSTKAQIQATLEENIRATIGVPYELIVIDNSNNDYSIFAAYNRGAQQSKYDMLCFMHEDICYHSQEWGKEVVSILNDRQIGIVGLAGSTFKSDIPSPWWISNYQPFQGFLKYNLIQHSSKGVNTTSTHHPNRPRRWDEVVVLDGFWLCCRKDVWQASPFDETHFQGFHFYDLDFCMSNWSLGLKNVVAYNILVEHFSAGSMNAAWFSAASVFHKKWRAQLPASTLPLSKEQLSSLQRSALQNHLLNTVNARCSLAGDWWRYFLSYFKGAPRQKENYIILFRYTKSVIKSWVKRS